VKLSTFTTNQSSIGYWNQRDGERHGKPPPR